jgi:hypothetical protein
MANEPLRRTPPRPPAPPGERPKIWAEGSQRPRFDLRAFGRASLHLAREGAAPLLAWAARMGRRVAVNVKNGAGRIPAAKLGRFAWLVPSHLRVAQWIKTFAAVLAHASASADPEVKRGNALVAEIEPHLWPLDAPGPEAAPAPLPEPEPEPVVPAEPVPPADDPLAAIRDDLDDKPAAKRRVPAPVPPQGPALPPSPPGPMGVMAVQITGYVLGWGAAILALPYGLARALWLHLKGVDLRGIGRED